MTTDKIKQWLLTGIQNPIGGRLVIMIDGWPALSQAQFNVDINELVMLCAHETVSVILSIDENTWEYLRKNPGRSTSSVIGDKAAVVQIGNFDEDEFKSALKILSDKYKISFYPGAEYNTEYRKPSLLRIRASEAASLSGSFPDALEKGKTRITVIPSITDLSIVDLVWDKYMSDPELRQSFRKLAQSYIKDQVNRDTNPLLSLMSLNEGYMLYDTAETLLGSSQLTQLRNWGYLSFVNSPDGTVLVLPKYVEMLSSAAAFVMADEIKNLFHSKEYDKAYKYVMSHSTVIPLGDIVGAKAIILASKREDKVLGYFIPKLLSSPPIVHKAEGLLYGLAYFSDIGEVPLDGVEMTSDDAMIDNLFPWTILSQISINPYRTVDNSFEPYLEVLSYRGSFQDILRLPDRVRVKDMKPIVTHDIKDRGIVICEKMGIVEPITYAMLVAVHQIPDEMMKLANKAVKGDKLQLGSRLSIAAKYTLPSTDASAANAAININNILKSYLK